MHLQQTKAESRATGGPQYYFHDLAEHVKEFLRKRGTCPVVLQTPYGIVNTPFIAVGRDHKISAKGKPVPGKVGHDRVQGHKSIGEAIRHWYGFKAGRDFERIDVDVAIHPDGHFILIPISVTMRGAKRAQTVEKVHCPLSFHHDYQSKFWKKQIETCRKSSASDVSWAGAHIRKIVAQHQHESARHVHEADLLRAAGALSILGLDLSLYLTKGYDCPRSQFNFAGFPAYPCPVEVKKSSSRFNYQVTRYTNLPRVVVLCIEHDFVNPPDHVDILELSALADYLRN